MIRLSIVVITLFLVGCAANVRTQAVRGVSGIEADCSGLGASWEKCYRRAALERKVNSYKVITTSSDLKEDAGDWPFGWNPAGYVTRTMLVMCR